MKLKHKSPREITRELTEALAFDVRDNPKTAGIMNDLIHNYGLEVGKKRFIALLMEDLEREQRGDRSLVLFPWTRAAMKTIDYGEQSSHNIGLGFVTAVIGLAGAAATVAGNFFTVKYQTEAQKDIAELQAQTRQQEAAAAQAAAEAQQAQAVAELQAILAQQGGVAPSGGATPAAPSPIPGIDMNTLLLVGGAAAFVIFVLPKLGR